MIWNEMLLVCSNTRILSIASWSPITFHSDGGLLLVRQKKRESIFWFSFLFTFCSELFFEMLRRKQDRTGENKTKMLKELFCHLYRFLLFIPLENTNFSCQWSASCSISHETWKTIRSVFAWRILRNFILSEAQ